MSSKLPAPSDYTSKLAASLNDLRKEKQLCDIIINVDGRAFHAHKNVLAARSSYFLAMFTSGFRETTQGEVNIDCGKSKIFELLLEYVYTGKLEISGETAYDLLEMACFMQLTDLSQQCSSFLHIKYAFSSDTDEKIAMGDVYKIYEMASLHGNKILAEMSEKHMCIYFQKLKSLTIFLQGASVEFLKEFLSRSDLATKDNEKEVLELVVNWLKHDWEKRRGFAASLLNKVRLGLIPDQILTELLDADILEIPECKQLLQDVQQKISCNESTYKLSQMFPDMFATRSSIMAPIAISAPEDEGTICNSFYFYNTKYRQWWPIHSITPLEHLPSLIVVEDTLYAVCGVEEVVKEYWSDSEPYDSDRSIQYETTCKKTFHRYDAEQHRWVPLPPSSKACKERRLVYMNGCIYAIGGLTDLNLGCNVCEYFDIAGNKWHKIAPLPRELYYSCSSAVAYQGNILLYGYAFVNVRGNNDLREEMLVYSSINDEWQSILTKPKDPALTEYRYNIPNPVLFVHGDHCYRVAKDDHTMHMYSNIPVPQKAVVHLLRLSSSASDVVPTVTVGDEIKQDFIPVNSCGAFRVGDEVFVTSSGVVHQTDLKIHEDQDTDIDLGKWKGFANLNRCSNIVNFFCDCKD